MSLNDLVPLAIAGAFALYLASLTFVFLFAGPWASAPSAQPQAKSEAVEAPDWKQAA